MPRKAFSRAIGVLSFPAVAPSLGSPASCGGAECITPSEQATKAGTASNQQIFEHPVLAIVPPHTLCHIAIQYSKGTNAFYRYAPKQGQKRKRPACGLTQHSGAATRACVDLRLRVCSPRSYERERAYVYRVLFQELLGLRFELVFMERDDVRIELAGSPAAQPVALCVADGLFGTPEASWLTTASLPRLPLSVVRPPMWLQLETALDTLPVLFPVKPALVGDCVERRAQGLQLRLDIFGASFFMLTRYEEAMEGPRDAHGRFPASASLAARADFLERPLVNEYVELLWGCLKALWPELSRRQTKLVVRPSHDADVPLEYGFRSPLQMARRLSAGLLRRERSSRQTAAAARDYLRVRAGAWQHDPAFTFDWIMDQSEARGLHSAFFFLVDESERGMGDGYSINHPAMQGLLRRIHARGHEIGLHASYRSLGDPIQLHRELERLQSECRSLGIEQAAWGVRHHYLRWSTPQSFRDLDVAGFAYDTTLTYADRPGFRCGVCSEYPVFDLKTRSALELRERPLVMMECSIIDQRYMGLGRTEAALELMLRLLATCRRFGGEFTCLWHNDRFANATEQSLYQRLLAGAD